MRKSLQNIVLAGAAVLSGCYSQSFRDAPRPPENTVLHQAGWNRYVSNLDSTCRTNIFVRDREDNFHQYIRWMNELTGKNFDPANFHIVHSFPLISLFTDGLGGLFAPSGIFWYGEIYVRDEGLNLGGISHEYGHSTDAFLNYPDYMFSVRSRVRTEAVAEAFEDYVGCELIRNGNKEIGEKQVISSLPSIAAGTTLDDFIDENGRYESARLLTIILMNEFKKIKEVWYYLATTPEADLYNKIEELITKNSGLQSTARTGYDLLLNERRTFTPQTGQ